MLYNIYTIPFLSVEWMYTSGFTFLLIAIILIVVFKYFKVHSFQIGKGIGAILLLNTLVSQFYLIFTNQYTLSESLPLHLCDITGIMAGLVLIKPSQHWAQLLFFWGISAALHSLLTPELNQGANPFLLFQYFVAHGGMLLAALYVFLIYSYLPQKKSWLIAFMYIQVLVITIGVLNFYIPSNYMYLRLKPTANNLLVIGHWPYYILIFEIAAIAHFIILYYISKLKLLKAFK
jgi:hypothetical integral membrane protein (TIGR02206 family)